MSLSGVITAIMARIGGAGVLPRESLLRRIRSPSTPSARPRSLLTITWLDSNVPALPHTAATTIPENREDQMSKQVVLVLMALSVAASAGAQTKLTGKVHCAKADPDYSIEVGDKPGHVLTARKSACTWTEATEIAGLKVKSAQDVATGEADGAIVHDAGYHVATMDNGDTYTVHFMGNATGRRTRRPRSPASGRSSAAPGKLKGIKGGGTYKGTGAADGSADVEVEGDYALGAKTTAPAPKQQ